MVELVLASLGLLEANRHKRTVPWSIIPSKIQTNVSTRDLRHDKFSRNKDDREWIEDMRLFPAKVESLFCQISTLAANCRVVWVYRLVVTLVYKKVL